MGSQMSDMENRNNIARKLGYPDYCAAIVGLYEKGFSATYIGGCFGLSYFAIYDRMNKLGIPRRPRGGDRKSKAYQEGKNAK
jgi:hypothetical protein